MGVSHSSFSQSTIPTETLHSHSLITAFSSKSLSKSPSSLSLPSTTCLGFDTSISDQISRTCVRRPTKKIMSHSGNLEATQTHHGFSAKPTLDFRGIDQKLIDEMVYDALVWSSLHGLVVGDKSSQVCALIAQ